MKIRIQGNSLRLRLGPTDVQRLLEIGRLEEHIAFGPQASNRLHYAVEISADAPDVAATFDGAVIRVSLPVDVARRWSARADQVGVEAVQDVGGGVTGERLSLLIEKDFACLHRDGADADAYANPRQGARPAEHGSNGNADRR